MVIESFALGTIDQLGLGWEVLHRENPALVLCSIAPFGQTGPYRDFIADDTVLTALGGMLTSTASESCAGAAARPAGLPFVGVLRRDRSDARIACTRLHC